ncbi:MAG: hypothetical protein JXP34_06530 [Planctomycetes bacterium]|nr:hypothetical protein [Planctomycetota bacterium]
MTPIGLSGLLLTGTVLASGARVPELDLASLAWQAEEVVRVDALRPSEREGEFIGPIAEVLAGTLEAGDEIEVLAPDDPLRAPAESAKGAENTEKAEKTPEPEESVAVYLFLRKESVAESSAAPILVRPRWVPVPGGIRVLRDDKVFTFFDASGGGRGLFAQEKRDGTPYDSQEFEEDLASALSRAAAFRALMASPETPARAEALGSFLLSEVSVAFTPLAGGLRSAIVARGLEALARNGRPLLLLDIYAAVERALEPASTAWLDWSIWDAESGMGAAARILADRIGLESGAEASIDALAVLRGFLLSRAAGQALPPDAVIGKVLRVAEAGEAQVRAAAAETLLHIARHLVARGWGPRIAPRIDRLYRAEGYPGARFPLAVALYWTAGEARYREATGDRLSIACQVLPMEAESAGGAWFEARFRAWRLSPTGSAPRALALVLERLDADGHIAETRSWAFDDIPFAASVSSEDRRARFPLGPHEFGGRIVPAEPLASGTWSLRLVGEAEADAAGGTVRWVSEPALLTVGS